jgi:hypothetical protein
MTSDSQIVPGGQGVAGSYPAVPTDEASPLVIENAEVSGCIGL